MTIIALDKKKRPLSPCAHKRASLLLMRDQAMVDSYTVARASISRAASASSASSLGNLMQSVVLSGKKTSVHVGHMAISTSGSFNFIQTPEGVVQDIHQRRCRIVQRGSKYDEYGFIAQSPKEGGTKGHTMHAALPLPGLKTRGSRTN